MSAAEPIPGRGPATLPASHAEAFTVEAASSIRLVAYAWNGGPADAPALLVSHANGFNAGCYQPFLALLSRHFRVFTYDHRGHGASAAPPVEDPDAYALASFAADMRRVVEAVRRCIGDAPLHLCGHSLGSYAGVMLAGSGPAEPFESLCLFDPPIYPPQGHDAHAEAIATVHKFVRWSARRPAHFPDRSALDAFLASVPGYARFDPAIREACLDSLTCPDPSGGLALRCPPLVESRIYGECTTTPGFETAAGITTRACIFAADPETARGIPWTWLLAPDLAAQMRRGSWQVVPGGSHLMVMEMPRACAEIVRDFALADSRATAGARGAAGTAPPRRIS